MKSKTVFQIIGWYGVLAILLGYILISYGILSPRGNFYQTLMFTGATSVMLEAFQKKDYQSVILNIVFAIIALITLLTLAVA